MNFNESINFKLAMENTDNDIDLFESLIEAFLHIKNNYIENLENAISDMNSKNLQLYAHQAKSGLELIGAKTASKIAFELEQKGKSSNFNNIDKIFEVFEKELDLVKKYALEKNWTKQRIGK
jgi:HPt (histidine-containing phosphotransfer) domain-containing protein